MALDMTVLAMVAAIVGTLTWAIVLGFSFLRSPFGRLRVQNHTLALASLIRQQELALSVATEGGSYFYAHAGCGHPVVWCHPVVLDNFQRMEREGVDMKIIVGRRGAQGEEHAARWAEELQTELARRGVTRCVIRDRELPNHSIVAGNQARSRLYLCAHNEEDKYPTECAIADDVRLAREWKEYLGNEFDRAQVGRT